MQLSDLKLTILHKGLILLVIPFALQAAVFMLLFGQVNEVERFAERQKIRTELIEQTSSLTEDFGTAWVSIFSRVLNPGTWVEKQQMTPEAYKQRVTQRLDAIAATPGLSERLKELVRGGGEICQQQYLILKRVAGKDRLSADNVVGLMNEFYSMKKGTRNRFQTNVRH